MSDTNLLQFSLRERGWLRTKPFTTTKEPGQTLLITADPMGALLQQTDSQATVYASSLAFTMSRFRDFRYLGTKVSLVPVATNAEVDPAHVAQTDTISPEANVMHPRDIGNMIHWRRWVGGNIAIPSLGLGSTATYSLTDAYNLDAAWLSDVRFNHAPVSDGFSLWTVPLRASAELPAHMTNAVFAYAFAGSTAPDTSEVETRQPRGAIALTGGDVYPDSWGPNPLAGFLYKLASNSDPIHTRFEISGISNNFPWFGDTTAVPAEHDVTHMVKWVRQRYLAPICILRLPCAYGTSYFWTLYMRHYYAVRRPYLVNGAWLAGKVTQYIPTYNSPAPGERMMLSEGETIELVQMIAADPYGAGDSTAMLRCDAGPAAAQASIDAQSDMGALIDAKLDEFDRQHGMITDPEQPEPEPPKKKHPLEAEYVDR